MLIVFNLTRKRLFNYLGSKRLNNIKKCKNYVEKANYFLHGAVEKFLLVIFYTTSFLSYLLTKKCYLIDVALYKILRNLLILQ